MRTKVTLPLARCPVSSSDAAAPEAAAPGAAGAAARDLAAVLCILCTALTLCEASWRRSRKQPECTIKAQKGVRLNGQLTRATVGQDSHHFFPTAQTLCG